MDRVALERLVRSVLEETLTQAAQPSPSSRTSARSSSSHPEPLPDSAAAASLVPSDVWRQAQEVRRQPARDPAEVQRVRDATPARVAVGRVGTRYPTKVYVGLRAEHAIAIDAVHSEVPTDFPARLGCIALRTRASDKNDYLLHPNHGRRLSDESRARLQTEASHDVDVQVIAADGLASWAILRQGEVLVPALVAALTGCGFRVGRPLFVHFARIGVQDEIGVLTRARATVILVGERPGLGTGDSLSMYTAYAPRLDQDNAEKNCISNIRPLGLPPLDAVNRCADLLQRTFAAGGGGVHLVRPVRDVIKRPGGGL